ncbi:arginine deiminase-related protein [Flavobacteriaceae bacterium]|nr:arginine deiminase-related protein [Flavobacteriaceae bacterium]
MKQTCHHLLMISPVSFAKNAETAVNNFYQKESFLSPEETQYQALKEFNSFVEKLRNHKIKVTVVKDTPLPVTPDSIFPNNWISFHQDGRIGIYPMFAENRNKEVRMDILNLFQDENYAIEELVDFRNDEGLILEGTGSIILDRENRVAYCALSPRADKKLFIEFCEQFNFDPVVFHAYQTVGDRRELIYHTNVMMCMADEFVVICLDTIDDLEERAELKETFKSWNKEIIEISENQVEQFAGNMLQVQNVEGKKFLVMSQAAKDALNSNQIQRIERFNSIISSDLSIIENCGGGSARCMMAEVFLEKN